MDYIDQMREWHAAGRPVRGHLCEGLAVFQQRPDKRGEPRPNYQCRPIIEADGRVVGCDDINEKPVEFCPFCGVALA